MTETQRFIVMAYHNQIIAPKAGLGGNPAVLIEAALERFTSYMRYRKTLAELSRLDDRQLADLGLSRSGLRSTAHDAVQATR